MQYEKLANEFKQRYDYNKPVFTIRLDENNDEVRYKFWRNEVRDYKFIKVKSSSYRNEYFTIMVTDEESTLSIAITKENLKKFVFDTLEETLD